MKTYFLAGPSSLAQATEGRKLILIPGRAGWGGARCARGWVVGWGWDDVSAPMSAPARKACGFWERLRISHFQLPAVIPASTQRAQDIKKTSKASPFLRGYSNSHKTRMDELKTPGSVSIVTAY